MERNSFKEYSVLPTARIIAKEEQQLMKACLDDSMQTDSRTEVGDNLPM